jgi:hypothetical protein
MSATAKLLPTCDERKSLALQVADAVTKVYDARKRYEIAKNRKASNIGELYDAVLRARATERNAMHALRQHIEQHECSV